MPSRQGKSVTLKQVAAEAGVSIGIAARVLGGYGSFSEKSRLAVLAAAEKLNYRANGVARSLRLKRTNTIGVLISQISSYHWTTFVQGVEEAARQAGYGVVLANTGDDSSARAGIPSGHAGAGDRRDHRLAARPQPARLPAGRGFRLSSGDRKRRHRQQAGRGRVLGRPARGGGRGGLSPFARASPDRACRR